MIVPFSWQRGCSGDNSPGAPEYGSAELHRKKGTEPGSAFYYRFVIFLSYSCNRTIGMLKENRRIVCI